MFLLNAKLYCRNSSAEILYNLKVVYDINQSPCLLLNQTKYL